MRLTRIITAKIEPEIFRKIVDGSKRFEVLVEQLGIALDHTQCGEVTK